MLRRLIGCLAMTLASIVSGARADPPVRSVSQPVEREVADALDFTGRVVPRESATIRPRVDGYVSKVHVDLGSRVKKDQLLVEIDSRVQQAEVNKVRAQLAQAEARLGRVEKDTERLGNLVKQGVASREEFEQRVHERDEMKALIQATRAELDRARLMLDFTRIKAPFDGVVTGSVLSEGNLVRGDGTGELLRLVTLDRPQIIFDVDEASTLRVGRLLEKGEKPQVLLRLGSDHDYTRKATLERFGSSVDPATRTVMARASLAEPDKEVLPGMFVAVRLPLGPPRKELLVNEAAVISVDGLYSVLVVGKDNKLAERKVTLGGLHDGLREVKDGLRKDDVILVGGARGLRPGDEIEPRKVPMPRPRQGGGGQGRVELPEFPGAGPALVVSASYPGANAQVTADAVGAPIEKQLDGLEDVTHRFATYGDGGEVKITLAFKKGTDLDRATVRVQNRVALAEPTLPDEVRRQGITVRRRSIQLGAVAVTLKSVDGGPRELVRAAQDLRTELARVPGVAEVTLAGAPGPSSRLVVDVDRLRLRALALTPADVDTALKTQNLVGGGGGWRWGIGEGRVGKVEDLADVVLKTDPEGRTVRLRDVATVREVESWSVLSTLDGKPCVLLNVAHPPDARPQEVLRGVTARLKETRPPEGVTYRPLFNE